MTPADQAAERLEALLHYLELIDRDGLGSAGRHAARMKPASDSFAADLKLLLSERRKPDPLGEGLDYEEGKRRADQANDAAGGMMLVGDDWLTRHVETDPDMNVEAFGAEPSLVSPPPPLPPQLLALSKAATPGPWFTRNWGIRVRLKGGEIKLADVTVVLPVPHRFPEFKDGAGGNNAAFIVAAINYIRSCESAGAESTPGEGV